MAESARIERMAARHLDDWLTMRTALWPATPAAEHDAETRSILQSPELVAFIALDARTDGAEGFAEASVRRDYVNGCAHSPVAFLEGIFVAPRCRRQGIARRLCAAVAHWGKQLGCRELASDALIDNRISQAMHVALGFAETDRVIFFRKEL